MWPLARLVLRLLAVVVPAIVHVSDAGLGIDLLAVRPLAVLARAGSCAAGSIGPMVDWIVAGSPDPPSAGSRTDQTEPKSAVGRRHDSDSESARNDGREEEEDDSGSGSEHYRSADQDFFMGGPDVVVPAGEDHPTDIVAISNSVTVNGDVHGDIVVIGATLVVTGTVRGDVVVVGGVGRISGVVQGDLVSVASRFSLEPTAFVQGSYVNVLGRASKAPGARIGREFTSISFFNLGWFATGKGAVRFFLFLLFWVALIGTAIRFLGILVVSALASSNVEGALAPPRPSWILAFFVGFLVHVLAMIVDLALIALCVTIPVAVVLGLAVRVVKWMGLSSIYLLAGRRIAKAVFGREFSYFACILTGFLVFALIGFIPFAGWLISAILSVTGLGLMIMTRFGARNRAGH